MFVIAWRLNIPEIECPRIRIFLPQRRKARQVRREKMNYLEEYFLPLFSDLCGLGVFAGDIPSFGCGCSPTGEPLFPSAVWGKAGIAMHKILRNWRKFSGNLECFNTGIDSRQGAKYAKFGIERYIILGTVFTIILRPWRPWRPFDKLRTCFAGDIPGLTGARSAPYENFFAFFAPFAVNFPVPNPFWLRLCRAKLFAVKSSDSESCFEVGHGSWRDLP